MTLITVKKISARETFPVRHAVLRQGKPLESCQFDGDDQPSTAHFGLFEDDHLAGVASLFQVSNALFEQKMQLQLRGMAVLEDAQHKGYGQMLLRHSETSAMQNDADILWFNARDTAVGFYKNAGYETIGNAFIIKEVGVHFVMYKHL